MTRAKGLVKAATWATGIGLLVAASAVAGQPGGTGAGEAQAKSGKDDPNRRVCRNIIPSGSRLSTRVCRTKAEWDRTADRASRFVQEGQMKGSSRDGDANARGTFGPR